MYRAVHRILISDAFRNLALFLGGIAFLLTSIGVGRLSSTINEQRKERICRFDISAEVSELQARIAAVTGRIFVVAIVNPRDPDNPINTPELLSLAANLDDLISELEPAITAQNEASKNC